MMTTDESLDDVLEAVRHADRATRIELRDRVAAFGSQAIEAVALWLDDRELAAFAVRVLERIGRQDGQLRHVCQVLAAAHPDAALPEIGRDIEAALARLGGRLITPAVRQPRGPVSPPPPGRAGRPGRKYWAMRTSDSYPDFIWAEIRRGRLRQGWGWMEEQDLRRLALRRHAGIALSPGELAAWPAHRMLSTEPDGIQFDDLIVTQNLPRQGRLSVCRVVGPYAFDIPATPEDYGHILPVELLVEDVNRHDLKVSEGLRRAISLRPRLYEVTPYGGDIEDLVGRS